MNLVEKFMKAGFSVQVEHQLFPIEETRRWDGCPYDMVSVEVRR